jgi:hypothetical protein
MEARLDSALQAGNYYEYAQLFKTLFFKLKTRKRIVELKAFVNSSIEALATRDQGDLVVELTQHYFEDYVRPSGDADDFFFKISKYAFEHGSEDRRYSYLQTVIKFYKDDSLIRTLAEAYKANGDYLRAYVYFVAADKPLEVVTLLDDHIIPAGKPSERNLFIL